MRVVIHHRTQGQGVEGVHLLGMAGGFEHAGAEVAFVSPPGVTVGTPGAPPVRGKGLRALWHVLARRLPEFVFELLEMAYNVAAVGRIRAALRGTGAGAGGTTILYERYAFFNIAGALAARAARVPFVLEVNYTTDTALYRSRSRMLLPLARAAERMVFRRADVIAAVSTVLRERVLEQGIAPERVFVMPNAADPERFRGDTSGEAVRARLGLGDARIVGFSGAFFPWHGVALILDALPRLLERVPKAAVLLIGEGPERVPLEARAQREGLSDRVRFVGWVTHEDLPAHLAAFDVAVMPDSNEYGSPMKIYEYMAMGKPVVAPRLGPLEDGIVDGRTGLLFARGDAAALGEALASLLADDARRLAMGDEARQHVRRNHTWDRNADRALERLAAVRPEAVAS